MIPLGCVSGRFQPVHEQHLDLFEIALAECRHLIVAVTNPDSGARHAEATSTHRHTASANPFTYFERVRLLELAVRGRGRAERITIVPLNLTVPVLWPQYVPRSARQYVRACSDWERQKARWFEEAGYAVSLLDGDPSTRLSASDIRARMQAGDCGWQPLVPTSTKALLSELLDQVPMAERT